MASTFLQRINPSVLFASAKSAIDSIRINEVTREMRDGRAVWVKVRKRGSEQIAGCANVFFRLAENPVRVWRSADTWRQWEVESFQLLHGDRFHASIEGPRAVTLDDIPGVSLCDELEQGRLTDAMIEAAARELARVHALSNGHGPWSHGDARLGNFLFDQSENRARLIDFEVTHLPRLSADERRADDLLVLLQDLVGRLPDERWLPDALLFLSTYGNRDVVAALKKRFNVPVFGFPRLWWGIRTRYMPRTELVRRVRLLCEKLP